MTKLILYGISKIITESLDNIYYCEAEDSYTKLYLKNGKYHLATHCLKKLEQTLAEYGFIRCHRSYIVNLLYIKEFDKKQNSILLANEKEIPVSDKYRASVLTSLYENTINID